ncbi:hypothetical protein CF326_g1376, partial [Tilletia indica]
MSSDSTGTLTAALNRISPIPTLEDIDTYFRWTIAVENAFLLIGAHNIVEGHEVRPTDKKEKPSLDPVIVKANELWDLRDRQARALIRASVNDATLVDIMDCPTAAEMWTTIGVIFDLDNDDNRGEIRRDIMSLFLQENSDATTHVNAFMKLLLRARAANWIIADDDKRRYFLESLPGSFDNVKIKLEMKPVEKRTFVELRRIFNAEVANRSRITQREEAAIMMTAARHQGTVAAASEVGPVRNHTIRGSGSSRGRGRGRGRGKGRFQPQGHRDDQGKDRSERRCHNCQRTGHYSAECKSPPAPHTGSAAAAVSTSIPLLNRITNPFEDLIAMAIGTEETQGKRIGSLSLTREWVVDSAATDHITGDSGLLTNVHTISPPRTFKIAKGSTTISAAAEGTHRGRTENGVLLRMDHVQYIPNMPMNLMSAPRLVSNGWEVHLSAEDSYISKDGFKLPLIARGRLFLLTLRGEESQKTSGIAAAIVTNKVPSTILEVHRTWGHVGITVLKRLIKEGRIVGLEIKPDDDVHCEACLQAKTARLSFDRVPVRAEAANEIAHSDVSGPLIASIDGAKYFATHMDDFTGFLSVTLLENKGEVAAATRIWITQAQRAFGTPVKVLRTDNGTEYGSKEFQQYLKAEGILHQTTTPYTPQLNGRAERINRTLKEMAAAMLIDSGIGAQWWGHALQFAVAILNRISIARDGKTLWEHVYKRRADGTHLRPFGAEAWVRIPSETRRKNDLSEPKAWKGRLVGLPTTTSGWMVYNEKTKKIAISRDVIFSEPKPERLEPLPNAMEKAAGATLIELEDQPAPLQDDGAEVPQLPFAVEAGVEQVPAGTSADEARDISEGEGNTAAGQTHSAPAQVEPIAGPAAEAPASRIPRWSRPETSSRIQPKRQAKKVNLSQGLILAAMALG